MINSIELNQEYIRLIKADQEKNRNGAEQMQEYLENSALYYRRHNDSRYYMLHIPKVFTEDQKKKFEQITEMMYRISCKVISEYLKCEDYRALFPFSKELEELILLPRGYDSLLPMARFDIFYHEDTGDFYFCEINTDGASAMNEDRIMNEALIANPAHRKMLQRYSLHSFELFDSWVEAFLEMYRTYEKAEQKALPRIAIVDFMDVGTIHEFEEFARRFQNRGMLCEVCDIRSLSYRDGKLYTPDDMPVDAIYRRAVTSDIMRHYDEVGAFLQAVRDQNVFLAGAFCTQVIHNKWLFYVLHHERSRQFLNEEEIDFIERHIPFTGLLSAGCDKNELIENKDDYIIKPLDLYAARGVYAGVECDAATWEKHLSEYMDKDYLFQKYCPQFRTDNVDFVRGDGEPAPYINMTGLFCYNGTMAGIYSRMSAENIIVSYRNERVLPTLVLDR